MDPIWLDCDPGIDDVMAIMMAGLHPSLSLLGISSVAGNVPIEEATQNALEVIFRSGLSSVPVVQGAPEPLCRSKRSATHIHGKSGLGSIQSYSHNLKAIESNSFQFMAETILASREKVTFVVTGPLTNCALLLKVFPHVKNNIERIVFMGGSTVLGNVTPAAEFNIFCDPEAAKIVLTAGVPLVMVPLDVTLKAIMPDTILSKIQRLASTSSLYQFVYDLFYFYQEAVKNTYGKEDVPLHDPCAVFYVIHPEAFRTQLMHVDVETQSRFCDGRTVCDVHHVFSDAPKNVQVALDMDEKKFWKEMLATWKRCNGHSITIEN